MSTSCNWKFRCRISPDVDQLDELHSQEEWIPSRDQIRPDKNVMERKKRRYKDLENHWESAADYILSSVFLKNVTVSTNEKFQVHDRDITNHIRFVPNEFPYSCSGKHYVLWLGPKNDGSTVFSDDEITGHIMAHLEDVVGPDKSFDFAW
jgi:hypothetical protein